MINPDIPASNYSKHDREWYDQLPDFNNGLGSDLNAVRFMLTPLDEKYLVEPVDSFIPGSLPREEIEVRDCITIAIALRSKVSKFDLWWSRFFYPTTSFIAAKNAIMHLRKLCLHSPEYRAAICRIHNAESTPSHLKDELNQIIKSANSILF